MIPGLSYIPHSLTEEQEQALLQELDHKEAHWVGLTSSSHTRRVQHYGYLYDYKRRTVSESARPPLPHSSAPSGLAARPVPAHWHDLFPSTYSEWNQVIVNEYQQGQGISAHTDSLAYGEVIQCYTLGSGATMRFTSNGEKHDLYVEPRSLYVMAGEARYQWKHEMIPRKSDVVDGVKCARGRRISVTLRSVPVSSKGV